MATTLTWPGKRRLTFKKNCMELYAANQYLRKKSCERHCYVVFPLYCHRTNTVLFHSWQHAMLLSSGWRQINACSFLRPFPSKFAASTLTCSKNYKINRKQINYILFSFLIANKNTTRMLKFNFDLSVPNNWVTYGEAGNINIWFVGLSFRVISKFYLTSRTNSCIDAKALKLYLCAHDIIRSIKASKNARVS